MYQIVNQTFMCRCTRTIRLYEHITDVRPTLSRILDSGAVFISNRHAVVGDLVLYQITEKVKSDVPIGMWCPAESLEKYEIEVDDDTVSDVQPDDSLIVDECIIVNSPNVRIYEQKDSLNPIQHGFKPGDYVFIDREYTLVKNGIRDTRYHVIGSSRPDIGITDAWMSSIMTTVLTRNIYARTLSATPMSTEKLSPTDTPQITPRLNDVGGGGSEKTKYSSTLSGAVESIQDTALTIWKTGQSSKDPDSFGDNPVVLPLEDVDGENSAEEDENLGVTADLIGKMDYDSYPDEEDIDLEQVTEADSKALYEIYGLAYEYSGKSFMSIPIGRMIFVHGMPFQFTTVTDRRRGATGIYGTYSIDEYPERSGNVDQYGRTYAKDIAANMPIAVVVPGVPRYMTKAKQSFFGYQGSSNKMKGLWAPFWNDSLTDAEWKSAFQSLLDGTSSSFDYYSLQVDTELYFKFVNALCRNSAQLSGIGDYRFRGVKCKDFDWGTYNTAADQDYNMFEEIVGLSGGVSFAYDPLSAISDTLSNSTSESSFASMLNGLSAKTRELQFIGGQSGLIAIDPAELEASVASVGAQLGTDIISSLGGAFSRAKDFLFNIAKGFNIRFPEIWADSSHTRSYDIDMHFITPYATMFCKWRYVLVPFFHWFALAAPQAIQNMSIYSRPFLIKAFSRGYFNVELGIIESITWKRFGDGDMISADGVPTQIDVSVSFKDLYHVLTMGNNDGATAIAGFFNNTGLMDMIGTLSGVNMNRITIGERMALYTSAFGNAILGLGSNFMRHISDRSRQFTERYLYGL